MAQQKGSGKTLVRIRVPPEHFFFGLLLSVVRFSLYLFLSIASYRSRTNEIKSYFSFSILILLESTTSKQGR